MNTSLIRCVLIEDETLATERLRRLLLQSDDRIEIVAELESVAQARRWFAKAPPVDLIFADVQLADGLCFEIFEHHPTTAPIVLTTSYDAFALQAFNGTQGGYLLKPVKRSELLAIISRFRANRFGGGWPPIIGRLKVLLAKLRS